LNGEDSRTGDLLRYVSGRLDTVQVSIHALNKRPAGRVGGLISAMRAATNENLPPRAKAFSLMNEVALSSGSEPDSVAPADSSGKLIR
jgi:hypothetical protein